MAQQRESLGPKVHAEDFGPIRSASIDLRPLTVFIGPSNAGKSYLAILIYALHRHFGNGLLTRHMAPLIGASTLDAGVMDETSEALAPMLREVAAAVLAAADGWPRPREAALPGPQVSGIVRDFFDSHRNGESRELVRCFGVPPHGLVRRGSKSAHFGFSTANPEASLNVQHDVSISTRSAKTAVKTSLSTHDVLHLELQGRRDQLARFAELLHQAEAGEERLPRGYIERAELTGYPNFTYRPQGSRRPLPLTASSSMVSELAPVVHYLRQFAAPGDMLIVEEPESHLHPARQVDFVRLLAELVVAGVRVLLTTHSEWVLEELANIVERSKIPAQDLAESDRVALPEDHVGAWLFESGPDGSAVKRIDVNDSGLYPCGFREVGKQLEEDWERTSLRIAKARLADPKTSEESWDDTKRALLGPD